MVASPTTIDIKLQWIDIAQTFAAEQHESARQKLIFQNTLAILALDQYLQWGDIETSLEESYSWHPITRTLTAWADLLLPNYGRILCCPVGENNQINLPDIPPLGSLGYVVASVETDYSSIQLKGFMPMRLVNPETNQFFLDDMDAIANIFDELYLVSEERHLITNEILRMTTGDNDLEEHFAPLLLPDNLSDIIQRLNLLMSQDDFENPCLITNIPNPSTNEIKQSSLLVCAENSDSNYGDAILQRKITDMSQTLTQTILSKTKDLYRQLDSI